MPFGLPAGHSPALVFSDDTHQRGSIIIATTILLFAALLFLGAHLWVRRYPQDAEGGGALATSFTGT